MEASREVSSSVLEGEERLEFVLEAAGIGEWELDLETRELKRSSNVGRVFGYQSRLEESNFDDILDRHVLGEDRQAIAGALERSIESGDDGEIECRIENADGRQRWIWLHWRVLRNSEGVPATALGLVQDVTDRKEAQEELRQSETRLRKLTEIDTVGIIFFDPAGDIVDANDAFLRMGGYNREDLEERRLSWEGLTPPEWMPASQRAIEQLKTKGSTVPYEKEYYRKDGSRWWGLFAAKGLSDTEGVEFILDISEYKRLAKELQDAHAQLERRVEERTADLRALNDELETFNYSVSHDLRAPLRGIDGFSQVLLEEYSDVLDERARGYFERIRGGARRMGDLIDDLLALSSLSKGTLEREAVDLSALAGAIVDNLQASEPERNVHVQIEPGMIANGDERFLKIVLDNLLGNAWKFTSRLVDGRIEFHSEETGGDTVYVVRDNGAGFDSRYESKLFTPFQRLHAPNEFKGTGIGLAMVQRLIRRHGGRVWATSKLGEGAEFRFTLPEVS